MKAKEIYPDAASDGYFSASSYQPMIDSFGSVLLQVDDNDYQGDTRVLYRESDKFGILIFGWGSCSGCDALQACDSYDDLEGLRSRLESGIVWRSKDETLDYFKTHDWEGDYSWSDQETKQFVAKSIEILEAL